MSQVWVSPFRDEANPDLIRFHGDCDTSIIKGVLAVLIQLTAGKTVEEIEQLDVDEFFTRLKLDENLSPNRHIGIYAIVALMKQKAGNLPLSSRASRMQGQSAIRALGSLNEIGSKPGAQL